MTDDLGTVTVHGRAGGRVDLTAAVGPFAAGMLADLYTGGIGDPDATVFEVVRPDVEPAEAMMVADETGAGRQDVAAVVESVGHLPGGPGRVEFTAPVAAC
ncbi:hypothetical protein DVS28_b0423 (plasmid) [Euzebya pacifica]|uniref:Uncharacterized protein n=1 Tax=Euzebya pacifica TaxID=1608957 RepID=A0A346Y6S1_9ACTN|nr:hypothetical protein [Euzebya pacifica]AXV10168.1 hypothetical protein DVS28_b0423 [Euzebya pacifica]